MLYAQRCRNVYHLPADSSFTTKNSLILFSLHVHLVIHIYVTGSRENSGIVKISRCGERGVTDSLWLAILFTLSNTSLAFFCADLIY